MSSITQESIHVSVVIATYNRKQHLKKAINSLFNQTYPKEGYEVIVVDDGSTDGTDILVKNLMKSSPCELKLFKQENQGSSAARNLGIAEASGDLIGFIDDDCIASPTWIESAALYFVDPRIGGVVGCTLPQEEIKKKLFMASHTTKVTKDDIFYPTCNIFYRKKALNEVQGFDLRFIRYQDIDLANRILEKGHKILFGENAVVKHEVRYLTPLAQFRRWRKYEILPLLYKKHPDLRRKELLFGFIFKKHIYPILTLFLLFTLSLGWSYSKIIIILVTTSYLFERVLVDKKIMKYPLRVFLFPKNLFWDMVKVYYTLRGSIKYRVFVI